MNKPQTPFYDKKQISRLLGVPFKTLAALIEQKHLVPENPESSDPRYPLCEVDRIGPASLLLSSRWEEHLAIKPRRSYTSIELFAGCGGLALGMEQAGFKHVMLNESAPYACQTLRTNRPEWNTLEGDVTRLDYSDYTGKVDVVSGGFPCQAFSFAGQRRGFGDTRGTLFFEFSRAIRAIQPKVFIGENVRGLQQHDNGRTLETIKAEIDAMGYDLVPPQVLQAILYKVPQKRERLLLIGIRRDLRLRTKTTFHWPQPYHRILTVRDALKRGDLYDSDVPVSPGQAYPKSKADVLALVPPGGYWRDLPVAVQKRYMKASFYLGGGKTGMARRLDWDEPSLTLTCAPAQNQTERCHPDETRPLTVREYARIQTFPDDWQFAGPPSAQYKQIGNAVPVNLARAISSSVVRLLNELPH